MAFQWDKRQIRLGGLAFLVVFLSSLVAMKPFLPSAIYHNFATIYDYRFFTNRVVRVEGKGRPIPRSSKSLSDPPVETQKLLSDLKTTALLVLENNQVVYEHYALDGGEDVLSGSFSMAKSIVSILTGIALGENRIHSLEQPISDFIPEWFERDEGKITIRNLLQMTSGLDWNESYLNPFSITTEAYYGTDLMRTLLKQHLQVKPGSLFSYQSGTTQVLGTVVSRAVNTSLSEYASKKLWKPIGAERDALWSLDHEDGMEKAYCCFSARARDFARIGQLILDRGVSGGTTVVSESYLKEMTHPHGVMNSEGKPVDYYGYQWWVYSSSLGAIPYARGILGQAVIVIPNKNRVIVRLGKGTADRVDHHPLEVKALIEWGLLD